MTHALELLEALKSLRSYAASAWYDEGNCTEEEMEAMEEARLAIEKASSADPPMADIETQLKRELAARAIRAMGPRSPFWNCTICGAAHLSPLMFEHKPDCILADERPRVIVSEGGPRSFHTIEIQHAMMRQTLEAIAELNHGATGIAAREALAAIDRKEP